MFAYIPFTYENLIRAAIVGWLADFARLHPWLCLATVALAALSLAPDLARPALRRGAQAWLAAASAASLLLIARPVLARLGNDAGGLVAAFGALVPLVWLAGLDVRAGLARARFVEPAPGRAVSVFTACLGASLLQAGLGAALAARTGEAVPPAAVLALGLSAHLVAGCGLFALLALCTSLSDGLARFDALLLGLLLALGLGGAVRGAFAAIGLAGAPATLLASAAGLAFALAVVGYALRSAALRDVPVVDGTGLLADAFMGWPRPRAAAAAWIVVAGAALAFAAVRLAPLDWGGLIQRTLLLGFGAVALLALLRVDAGRAQARDRSLALLLLALVPLGAYRWLAGRTAPPAVRAYAARDASFALLDRLFTETADDPEFYRFLQRNTNLGADVKLAPVPVRLVERLAPSAGFRPHVIVIVVDSLRRDYLAPYNPAVGFTPEIGEFAKANVVFDNAFTRYGATGLSEPSIWVGGMLPHKQYVTPFRPMNALQSLLETDGYASLVSRDTVLETVVTPWPALQELDEGVLTRDYDLCRTLEELQRRLPEAAARGPVFAYTQPQNLHVSQITAQGASVPAGESYPGFYAPYASRLRRIDACFGRFLRGLQAQRLYDDSVVILTADHGEMLGEGGRFGHAYLMLPPIVRVPLVVHLPQRLQRLHADTRAPAFLTDIAPSLYALLGHGPILSQPLFGGPLFVSEAEQRAAYRRSDYVLASSYGAVYALLDGDARSLYVVDAVNYQDELFALSPDRDRPAALTDGVRARSRGRIRAGIQEVARFYGVPPSAQ